MDIGHTTGRARKLPIKKLPRKADRTTAEQRYWQTFKVGGVGWSLVVLDWLDLTKE